MKLTDIPLSVYNRAFDIYGTSRQETVATARTEMSAVRKRIGVSVMTSVNTSLTPLAAALAEYICRTGPWADDGEFAVDPGVIIED